MNLLESYKALGLIGFLFTTIMGTLIYLIQYIIKSQNRKNGVIEQKNNIIANHIHESTEVFHRSTEAIERNTVMLSELRDTIRDLNSATRAFQTRLDRFIDQK